MTPTQLRNSILQYAMEGKLVKQNPNDEPASILLEKIKVKKEQLIKEKKIKRTQTLLPITEDEIPYQIPQSWQWVKIGELVNIYNGLSYSKSNLKETLKNNITVVRGGNIDPLKFRFKNDDVKIDRKFIKNDKFYLRKNELLTPSVTSDTNLGKIAYIEKNYDDVVAGGFVFNIVPFISNKIFSKYFMYAFTTLRKQLLKISHKSGQAFFNLPKTKLNNVLIPLPPLEEQQRIVNKLEQLLPLIDQYAKSYNKLKDLDNNFNDRLKKSILQYAMEGKLVPQDANDESVDVLLDKIKQEKEQLLEEGKLRKQDLKPLPEITADEIPYQIPKSWKWVRLGDVLALENGSLRRGPFGSALRKNIFVSKSLDTYKVYEQGNVINQDLNYGNYYITQEKYNSLRSFHVQSGDILISGAGTLGKTFVVPAVFLPGVINQALIRLRLNTIIINKKFFLFFFHLKISFLSNNSKGSAIKNISSIKFLKENILIPLPPLAEQQRIVNKLEEILALLPKHK